MLPFVLGAASRRLFAIYYRPVGRPSQSAIGQSATGQCGDILFVPPFTEEMNRSRSMVAMQARSFALRGIGTLVLDPYGTGDSGGDFSDGTWDGWLADLQSGIDWLRESGNGCRTVWGLRLGAMMAAQLAQADSGIDRLLLWNPILNGKNFLTQFLRIRIAAELEQADGVKSTEDLRRRFRADEVLEISGYRVHPKLALGIDTLRFPEPSQLAKCSLVWCETLSSSATPFPAAATKTIDAFRQAGVELQSEKAVGPAFWQVYERAEAPDLLKITDALTAEWLRIENKPSSGQSVGRPNVRDIDEKHSEQPLFFSCDGQQMAGVLHRAEGAARRAIICVVAGGPQYRAGAHRQFVALARRLVLRGYPVLRFDLRGMGDSTGEHRGFQYSLDDIRAAIDALLLDQSQVDEVVLFGECESASGILFYAFRDSRVKGVVLVNPWVRTEAGRAGVIIKHYYWNRLRSREFWSKVGSGKFSLSTSMLSLVDVVRAYWTGRKSIRVGATPTQSDITDLPLPQKTAAGLRRFQGRSMILMSGRDYIAREFDEIVRSSPAWTGLLEDPRVTRRDMADADHTFSREPLKVKVAEWVGEWLATW